MAKLTMDKMIKGFQTGQDYLSRQITAKRTQFVELNRSLEVLEREFEAGQTAIEGLEKFAATLPKNETITLSYD